MKTVIEIPALVEATSSDEMVEASISLSAKDGQITLEIPEWESRIEIPAEHLTKALAALVPTTEKEPVNPVLVQHLGQKISRLEQQIAANPHQRLELEALSENLEALRREVLPRLGVVETWKEALEQCVQVNDRRIDSHDERITALEEENSDRESREAMDHVVALYGGEQ